MSARHAVLGVVAVGAAFMAARTWAATRAASGDSGAGDNGASGITVLLGLDQQPADTGGATEPYPVPGVGSFLDMVSNIGGDTVTQDQAAANVAAFLMMIRKAEGTADADGYRRIIGGQLFDSYADHPRVRVPFTQTDGVTNYSTAAGAYQFLQGTWDRIKGKIGALDFSPTNQDAGAVELIREAGALSDVKNGRFNQAVAKVARIWASLPGSPYAQRTRSFDFVQQAYLDAGGALA